MRAKRASDRVERVERVERGSILDDLLCFVRKAGCGRGRVTCSSLPRQSREFVPLCQHLQRAEFIDLDRLLRLV
jgi:hypothetical protein